ncbi:hypothetical protein MA16_Dca027647 [Dendrobium catenatum]|uniref:Uncharacterized protein n=1 Tax=Dendrobium catenatum TaxID=906689 RepID=A0A2I0VC77_9ASPA|nr:hypothetical protein MA16_Dca027647 [Dendrobium catenatum]
MDYFCLEAAFWVYFGGLDNDEPMSTPGNPLDGLLATRVCNFDGFLMLNDACWDTVKVLGLYASYLVVTSAPFNCCWIHLNVGN